MLRWVNTLKTRIETSEYGGRPITGVDLQPVKYGTWFANIKDGTHQFSLDISLFLRFGLYRSICVCVCVCLCLSLIHTCTYMHACVACSRHCCTIIIH